MGEIIIKEVLTRKDLRDFIYLPAKVHNKEPDWLPPIYLDEWGLYDKNKNSAYKYADAILYLACRGKKPVGRIMAIINNRYNSIKKEKHGRFCFMECFEDREVVHALLSVVEKWAKEYGMTKIVGPLGFSDKDPQGFQIEGFDYPQFITTPTNSPYLPRMMEWEGYIKEVDLVNYIIKMPKELPLIYSKVYERIVKTDEFRVIEFRSKMEIKPYIVPVLELMNETFSDIYGFVPLNEKEKKDLAKRYLPLLDPELIKVVASKEGFIGFVIGMPDISNGIKAANGKFFPFGIFKILKEMKKSKKLMLLLGGIKKDYRGLGIDVLMAVKMYESAVKKKMETINSHLILESNIRMRSECERLDGQIVKRFRIYQKSLQEK
jgi:hypothetical protein